MRQPNLTDKLDWVLLYTTCDWLPNNEINIV